MRTLRVILVLLLSQGIITAQTNTFPSTGNTGIGTVSPAQKLTVLGNIYSSGTIGGGGAYYNVLQVAPLGEAPAYFYFDTNIPANGNTAPQLHINGYRYGTTNRAMKITLGWYYWAGNFYWSQYQSDLGYDKPSRIRIGKYNKNGTEYIRVEIANDYSYWANYNISAVDPVASMTSYEGWTWFQGEMPAGETSQITTVNRVSDVSMLGRLDLVHETTDNYPGPVASSYPLATFINKSSSNGYRGLQIGAPTGNITSPVYLKVTGTGNRFAFLNQFEQENFTLLENGNIGIGTSTPAHKLSVNGSMKWGNSSSDYAYSGQDGLGLYLEQVGGTNNTSKIRIQSSKQGDFSSYAQLFVDPLNGFSFHTTGTANGNVGIGTQSPTEKLSVNGNIKAKKIIVSQAGWPDYVFDSSYSLLSLSEIETFITKNKHLPDMPSAKEVEEKGVSVGDNQALLLKKIEELTLYLIRQERQMDILRKDIEKLKQENQTKNILSKSN